jgi:hypothetical protein
MSRVFSLLEEKGFLLIENNYRGWGMICQLISLEGLVSSLMPKAVAFCKREEGRLSHTFLDA